jgi:hypothetical protein
VSLICGVTRLARAGYTVRWASQKHQGEQGMNNPEADPLTWLVSWYSQQCDGDWEHQYGIKIGTLDNPGWSLEVDLEHTRLSGRVSSGRLIERSRTDWIHVDVNKNQFIAAGGAGNLSEMITSFRKFAEGSSA